VGVNELPHEWVGTVRYGIAATQGGMVTDSAIEATIPENSAVELARIPMSEWTAAGTTKSLVFALLQEEGRTVAQNRILVEKFKDLEWGDPNISIERDGEEAVFAADCYVWGVCLDLDGEEQLPDNAFDLLPGIEYRVPWPQDQELPRITRTGNVR